MPIVNDTSSSRRPLPDVQIPGRLEQHRAHQRVADLLAEAHAERLVHGGRDDGPGPLARLGSALATSPRAAARLSGTPLAREARCVPAPGTRG